MFLDTKGRIRAAAIAFLAVAGCAITAHAGECPADQIRLGMIPAAPRSPIF